MPRALPTMLPLSLVWAISCSTNAQETSNSEITFKVAPEVVDGDELSLEVGGIDPGEEVSVWALRTLSRWAMDENGGGWSPAHFCSVATHRVPENGAPLDARTLLNGDDSLALLRNGLPFEERSVIAPFSTNEAPRDGSIVLVLQHGGEMVARTSFRLVPSSFPLHREDVSTKEFHGSYARPQNVEEDLPVVISLHGSEGGSLAKGRQRADRFAGAGFASLAINYFARPYEAIDGLRTGHEEVPLELLERAYEWLEGESGVDLDRVAVWGVSKGAEFALLAASHFDWIHSVVAVVPTDVVWAGYDGTVTEGSYSSWSLNGEGVPFIPLFPYEPRHDGHFRTNTERYSRSRAYYAEHEAPARIPIERTSARLLLLASERDEVWASGDMTRRLAETMIAAGKGDQVELTIAPTAGHQIAGTGTFPVLMYGSLEAPPSGKDVFAEGRAGAEAWQRTLAFLRSMKPLD